MKKTLIFLFLLTSISSSYADFDNNEFVSYSMVKGDGDSIWVLNNENGSVKQCYWVTGSGIKCSPWRLNDKKKIYNNY